MANNYFYTNVVNVASAFDQDMLEKALKDITLDGLQAHIELIFSKGYVKMLVSGNYNQSVALDASNQVLDILQFQPIPRSSIDARRSLDIEPGYYVQNVPISDQNNPVYVTQRINQFVRQYRQKLQELTVEEVESSVQSLISLKQEKLKSINDEFVELWAYIKSDKYNFDKVDEDIKHLKQLSKDNLLAFWDNSIESLLAELSGLYLSKQVSPVSSEAAEVTNTAVADMGESKIVFESSSKIATALQMAISAANEAPKFATLSKTSFANIDIKQSQEGIWLIDDYKRFQRTQALHGVSVPSRKLVLLIPEPALVDSY
ncbi:metalloprotease [Coemansia sp. S146]|nr:metalloprotease [Coemansia sp. S146]